MKFIPLSRPEITKEDKKAVLGVLNTPYLAFGPKLREFEERIAKYVRRKYAVAVNSGTSALHLIIRSLDIGKGDEVITTPFSFIASANCILFEGAKPVFVDIKRDTLNIDPELVERSITSRTKAILAVDVFGHPADWDAILKIAKRHRLYVIEDSAEAIGSEYKGRKCGSFGDAAIFSFYPNKQIVTGEGGILVTDNKKIYELSRSMRNQGRDERLKTKGLKRGEYRSWLEHVRLGYNYRISDINCALGIAQLKRLPGIMKKRERIFQTYNRRLRKIAGIKLPFRAPRVRVSQFVYVIQLEDGYTKQDRDRIIVKLKQGGIQASNYFPCIHLQPFYRRSFGYRRESFPVAEHVSERTIALPFYNTLSSRDIDFVSKALRQILS